MKINRLIVAIAGFSIVTAALLIFVLRPKTLPIERDARTILGEMQRGDGEGLYSHAYDHEKRALGLTPEKISAVYSKLILPRIADFRPVGPVQSMVNRDASQAAAWQKMQDSSGRSFDFDSTPWSSPEGGKQMVMARLMTAWIVEYRLKAGKPMDSLGCAEARLTGLKHDRKLLDEIGIPGMVSDNPRDPMRNWSAYEQYWQGMVERLSKKHDDSNTRPASLESRNL